MNNVAFSFIIRVFLCEAFLGSRVHEALEKLYKELILTKLNTLDDLVQYYKDQWDKSWHKDIAINKKEYTKEHYHDTGIKAITDYYKRHFPFNQSTTLATEQLITFRIDDYTIRGYIDRLSHRGKGIYEIHDYKTSGYLPTQEKQDSDRQLALYQIGVKKQFRDAEDIRLIWHYLRFDKDFESARTDAQLRYLKKKVVSLIKTIEKDTVFKPMESALCAWCVFPEYCPAKKHEYKIQELPSNKYLKERGVSLVNKYASIKAKIKELKEQEEEFLKELELIADAASKYAQKEGVSNITGSDFILKVIEENVLGFPRSGEEGREELEKFIKKAGIWEEVSGLNTARLSKMIEDKELDNKIKNGLLKFAEEVEGVRVRLVKKRGEEE
ncbi:MAG: PD-(D/E)XK nuclease family protein [Nitrospirae bacterium]|nr:PD-(D/E)XK nuclease family protein [Nitrospirota bacterium]